jgi:hypothetical protein
MDRAIALPIGLAFVVGLVLGVAARDDTGGEPAGETDGGSAAPAEDGTHGGDAGDGHVVAVEMTDSNENVPGTVHVEVTDTVRWSTPARSRTRSRRTTRTPGATASRARARIPATGSPPTRKSIATGRW